MRERGAEGGARGPTHNEAGAVYRFTLNKFGEVEEHTGGALGRRVARCALTSDGIGATIASASC